MLNRIYIRVGGRSDSRPCNWAVRWLGEDVTPLENVRCVRAAPSMISAARHGVVLAFWTEEGDKSQGGCGLGFHRFGVALVEEGLI